MLTRLRLRGGFAINYFQFTLQKNECKIAYLHFQHAIGVENCQ
jgi:hypothetical protein